MINYIVKKRNTLLKSLSESTKLPFSVINKKLREKQVMINKERVGTNVNVDEGDEVVIFAQVVEKTFEVVFEDKNILVAVKSKGIESAGANSMEAILQKTNKEIKACHRLDRNTEGLVIFSKNEDAFNLIVDGFKNDRIKKEYLAFVFGKPKMSATETAYLKKNAEAATVMIFNNPVKDSDKITTRYKKISQNGEISKLRVFLDYGGKTHQIRAHLASLGLPLVGDGKYGNTELNNKYKEKTQMLYSDRIVFNLTGTLSYLNDLEFSYNPKTKY